MTGADSEGTVRYSWFEGDAFLVQLRAVGGLTTAEIARSLLLPEATITRRITRAKQTIRDAGSRFQLPEPAQWTRRVDVVLHVIYLIFTEGHTASAGNDLIRDDLCVEAIRLARLSTTSPTTRSSL